MKQGSNLLLNILFTQIKDQLSLDNACIINEDSRFSDLGRKIRLEQYEPRQRCELRP